MSKRSTHHAALVIERNYAALPARVVSAWARDLLDNSEKSLADITDPGGRMMGRRKARS